MHGNDETWNDEKSVIRQGRYDGDNGVLIV